MAMVEASDSDSSTSIAELTEHEAISSPSFLQRCAVLNPWLSQERGKWPLTPPLHGKRRSAGCDNFGLKSVKFQEYFGIIGKFSGNEGSFCILYFPITPYK